MKTFCLAAAVLAMIGGISIAIIPPVRADENSPAEIKAFAAVMNAFVRRNCVSCHGPQLQEGKLRLDGLSNPSAADEVDTWRMMLDRLEAGDMPPQDAKVRPTASEAARIVRLLRERLGVSPADSGFPSKGNLLRHELLFEKSDSNSAATPARIWRISPYGYKGLANRVVPEGGRYVVLPFGLTTDPGFRDYAFRYTVSGSESEQMVLNAKEVIAAVLTKRPRYNPPKSLTAIADSDVPPTETQIQTAIAYIFDNVLFREPTPEESDRYVKFTSAAISKFGNRKGLVHGLTPIMLHPEAVFRLELGGEKADEFGRVMLTPLELALALSYALTDARPDAEMIAAARSGKLASREDARREIARLLGDPQIYKPRILRFFREYFGYPAAADVFKDEPILKAANIGSKYRPDALVADTDLLVEWVLAKDKDVLRELLTTEWSYVASDDVDHWLKFRSRREEAAKAMGVTPPTHPFGSKNKLHEHYNLPAEQWSAESMPFALPREQRAGILTQPSWLIAHSTNADNHAIHRGKWVRERLLGGSIPDTPITVEAKLPEEPEHTLRHRMRVTREAYCWTCHQQMDPLGLPFEQYDHLGRFRTKELDKPVDTTGEIFASGVPALDGEVPDAVTMIRKLADSERVTQVFVRHAFRYWLGRNETLADGPTLTAAYQAYQESGGSMNALITSLLTSDSFLYRVPSVARKQDGQPISVSK